MYTPSVAFTTLSPPQSEYATTAIEDSAAVQATLDALHDQDCQAILAETSDAALSAKELADLCGMPLSTTYRKLDMLAATGLVEERTRMRESGKHTSEYRRLVEDIYIPIDASGQMTLRLVVRNRFSGATGGHDAALER